MRIPLLMRYPPLVKPGSRPDALVLNIDLAPTLLDLAGIRPPASIQGRSWLPALTGRDAGRESFLYEYFRERDTRFNRPSTFAVRTRRWKYIEYPEHPKVLELYDLEADPHELKNLAADPAHADTLRKMQGELARLKKATGFRMPRRSTRRKKKET
jgi:arylsulfatase A-like enzyme